MYFSRKSKLIDIFPCQQTQEICLAAVSQNGRELRFACESQKTKEVCLDAVSNDPYAMNWVPQEIQTPEFYWEAVGKNGNVLLYISDEMKSVELCLRALIGGCYIGNIPSKFRKSFSKLSVSRHEFGTLIRNELLYAWQSARD